jgi:hypothetical protein
MSSQVSAASGGANNTYSTHCQYSKLFESKSNFWIKERACIMVPSQICVASQPP